MMALRCALVALVCASLTGCGGSGPKPVKVTGKVLVNDQPADGALVRLWPAGDLSGDLKPLGYVQADGSFELTTLAENDGAPPGRYTVTVEWRPKKKSVMQPDGPDRLNGRYADPKTSKIEVMVNDTPTTLEAIKLK